MSIPSFLQGPLYEQLFGSGKKKDPRSNYDIFSTLNPQQEDIFKRLSPGGQYDLTNNPLYQQAQSLIQELLKGGGEAYEKFAAPITRQFHEQTVPHLAEQFAGLGAGSSSGFQQALGQAGAGLGESLGALRAGLQQNALGQSLQFAQAPGQNLRDLLGIQTQAFSPKQKPFWQDILLQIAPQLAKAGTLAFL